MINQPNTKLTVVKHNQIIDAEYAMTVIEQRILLTCVARLDSTKEPEQDRIFTVSVDDIVDLLELKKSGSVYANLKKACDALFTNIVTVYLPDAPCPLKMRWVYAVGYMEKEGKVQLRFTPEMMPFLTKISKNFTKYKLENVIKFRSSYSIRIYEMIMRWGGTEYNVPVSWLKQRLAVADKYERFDRFKADVIEVAVREINEHSNMNVSYETIKRGRNVIAIKLKYAPKKQKQLSIPSTYSAPSVKKQAPQPAPKKTEFGPNGEFLHGLSRAEVERRAFPGESYSAAAKRIAKENSNR